MNAVTAIQYQASRRTGRIGVNGVLVYLVSFAAPIVAMWPIAGPLGSVATAVLAALDSLLVLSCLVALLLPQQRATLDLKIYWIVGGLGLCLALSSLYAIILGGETLDSRRVLLLAHFLLPYLWFVLAGPMFARPISRGSALTPFLSGILVAALWQIINAGIVVVREGASAWMVLAQFGGANSNVAGMVLVLGAAVILPLTHRSGWALRMWVVFAIVAIAVVWTFSRSSYIAFAAICLVHFARSKRGWLAFAVIALVTGTIYLAVPQALEAPSARLTYTTQGGELDPSARVRLELWKASIETFAANPIVGIGFGRSVAATRTDLFRDPSRLVYSHSYFLTLAAQLGIAGLILSVFVLLKSFRLARMRRPASIGYQTGLATIGVAIASLFGEPLFVAPLFVCYFMLVCGVTARPLPAPAES